MAATLAAWGRWQAALAPGRGPSVVDALVGSLGGLGAQQRARPAGLGASGWMPLAVGVLLDCGLAPPAVRGVLLCFCLFASAALLFVFLTCSSIICWAVDALQCCGKRKVVSSASGAPVLTAG